MEGNQSERSRVPPLLSEVTRLLEEGDRANTLALAFGETLVRFAHSHPGQMKQ